VVQKVKETEAVVPKLKTLLERFEKPALAAKLHTDTQHVKFPV
jgi:hypothetical protein